MNRQVLKCLALASAIMLSQAASAGLMGVNSIRVSNAVNTWLQIAELQAFDMFGVNVALTGIATSNESGGQYFTSPTLVNDGNTNGAYPNVFHEGGPTNNGAFVTLTLAAPTELSSIAIFGRTDCCSDRDVYNIEFFDSQNQLLSVLSDVDATAANGNVARIDVGRVDVPAPGPLALLGLGLLALVARGRARRA